MNVVTKLYLYDSAQEANGYRGQDLSAHIQQGDETQDNLDDTPDSGEITLLGITSLQKENPGIEYDPKSKFILEKWEEVINPDGSVRLNMYKDWHFCISNDTVSKPILSDDDYFDHHLTLAEPAADAQGRLVNNMAITYRLADIALTATKSYDTGKGATARITSSYNPQGANFIQNRNWSLGLFGVNKNRERSMGKQFIWQFPTWYQVTLPDGTVVTPSASQWQNFPFWQEIPQGAPNKEVGIPIPLLMCQTSMAGSTNFINVGFCSIIVIVERSRSGTEQWSTIANNNNGTTTLNIDPANISNENGWLSSYSGGIDTLWRSWDPSSASVRVYNPFGWVRSRPLVVNPVASGWWATEIDSFSQIAQLGGALDTTNRVVRFNVENGFRYRVTVTRRTFSPSVEQALAVGIQNYNFGNLTPETRIDSSPAVFAWARAEKQTFDEKRWHSQTWVTENPPSARIEFEAITEGGYQDIWVAASPPANALDLFNKAQLLTQNFIKTQQFFNTQGQPAPVLDFPKAFYLSESDRTRLRQTQVVENFYVQKNWWEILMDIGKYIHARPRIRFGSGGRFLVEWRQYGRTDQRSNSAYPINIFRGRYAEEYVAAASSYITNMVQLGGLIKETVSAKSSSEDKLVYNDVAEIRLNKSIIEIVDMYAINKYQITATGVSVPPGTRRNMTGKQAFGGNPNGFVFEKVIWELLPADTSTTLNRGNSLQYELGDNKITGLNYRLPTINPGDAAGDYAIKNILGLLFYGQGNSWANIKVNDFLFEVTYRTKDELRSNQTRPDFRKYLLSTPLDRVPIHEQFNNQTDLVIDSLKFGNQIYGKLIRTGNPVQTWREWSDSLFSLKEVGDLYNLDGELYYVVKVTNTYFADHIVSEIEYSKDFNRLSQIIGIPSEPRFFEISERSLVSSEVPLNDYIMLGTTPRASVSPDYTNFVKAGGWAYIANLLLKVNISFPKFALTVFKNDPDTPSSPDSVACVCHAVSSYSVQTTLTLRWEMVDNFSAGDRIVIPGQAGSVVYTEGSSTPAAWTATNSQVIANSVSDGAYYSLKPVRYKNAAGRADLIDFVILSDLALPSGQENQTSLWERLPKIFLSNEDSVDPSTGAPTGVTLAGEVAKFATDAQALFGNELVSTLGAAQRGIITVFDNREVAKFNYNLQMITDSDRFVLSSYMWQQLKGCDEQGNLVGELRVALLNQELNKMSTDTINNATVITDFMLDPNSIIVSPQNYIQIPISQILAGMDLSGVEAIVIYDTHSTLGDAAKFFVFGRNIGDLDTTNAIADWYISSIDKNVLFPKQ